MNKNRQETNFLDQFFIGYPPIYKKFFLGLVLVISVAAAVTGLYFGYRYYKNANALAAQRDLTNAIDKFHNASRKKGSLEWKGIADIFAANYEKHKSTTLGSYFLSFQAEALQNAGDLQGARRVLNELIQNIDDEYIKPLFIIKLALMNLDSADENSKANGLSALEQLGNDEKINYRDMALYYLGNYLLSHDDKSKAITTLQTVIDLGHNQAKDEGEQSIWISKAEQLLAQL